MNSLNEHEKQRYLRHLVLDEIGEAGQLKLKEGRALVVGAGGLGSAVLYYLAAAGVGSLGIVDSDVVELSNLQRQILHRTEDVGRPKVISAAEKLQALNPDLKIETFGLRLTDENAGDIIAGYDIIVDATDNFPARFVLNKACVERRKPFIHGGILGFAGQAMSVLPGEGPCYRCLFREPPPPGSFPAVPGVVGTIPGTIGTIQAVEVIKLLLGTGRPLAGRLLVYDALAMSFREVQVNRDHNCPDCGNL